MTERTILPEPLVPADVDLRDFAFMPLDVARLRDSELASNETPEACWAAVLLWAASWHQVPASSIPNDNKWMAKQAGYVSRGKIDGRWGTVKIGALRGFVECTDGRLYHAVVAEKAMDAWKAKLGQRLKTECARIKKHNQRHGTSIPYPEFDDWFAAGCPQGQPLYVPGDKAGMSPRSPHENQSKGQGEAQGQGQGQEEKENPPFTASTSEGGDLAGHLPTPAGLICRALKRAGISNVNPGHATLQVLLAAGATEAEFLGAVDAARDKGDPFAYLLGVVEGQRKRAAEAAKGLHQGAMPSTAGSDRKSRQLTTAGLLTGTARPPAPAQPTTEVFDVDARFIAP